MPFYNGYILEKERGNSMYQDINRKFIIRMKLTQNRNKVQLNRQL